MKVALRSKLLADAPLAALVDDVAWVDRPQASGLPFITLTLIAPGRDYTHDGWDGLNASLVQADIWASSVASAAAVSAALTAAMETPGTVDGWAIGPCFLEAEHDMPPEDITGGGIVYRTLMEWRVFNTQSEG